MTTVTRLGWSHNPLTERLLACGLTAFLFVSASSGLWAASYYVDSTAGNDSNPGTQSQPWRTVSRVNGFTFRPGDFVYFRRGSRWEEGLIPASGIAGSPVTYGAYGSGAKPSLDHCNITGKSHVALDNLEFLARRTYQRYPILIDRSHNIIVSSCNAFLDADTPYVWCSVNITDSSYNQILDCSIQRWNVTNQGDGMNLWRSTYNLIQGNAIRTATHYALALYSSSYNIIRQNTITNTEGGLMDLIANSGSNTGSDHNVIEDNIISGGGSSPFSASTMGIAVHNKYNIVRRNIVRDNPQTGQRGKGIASNAYRTNYNQGNRFYNNIVTAYANMAVNVETGGDGATVSDVYFKNNIFYANGVDVQIFIWENQISDYHFVNNIIYKQGQNAVVQVSGNKWSIAQAQSSRPASFSNNIQADPQLDSAFHPLPGSPAIDAGDFLTRVTSPTGSGATFTVADAAYFYNGFGLVPGDQIRVGSATVSILEVNYITRQITVSQTITWTSEDPVSLLYSGSRPDIGVFEHGSSAAISAPKNLRLP